MRGEKFSSRIKKTFPEAPFKQFCHVTLITEARMVLIRFPLLNRQHQETQGPSRHEAGGLHSYSLANAIKTKEKLYTN